MTLPPPLTHIEEDGRNRVIGEGARQQLRETMSQRSGETAYVTCGCAIRTPLRAAFRCLYCEEYFCNGCAELHFTASQGRPALMGIALEMTKGTAILAALEVTILFAQRYTARSPRPRLLSPFPRLRAHSPPSQAYCRSDVTTGRPLSAKNVHAMFYRRITTFVLPYFLHSRRRNAAGPGCNIRGASCRPNKGEVAGFRNPL